MSPEDERIKSFSNGVEKFSYHNKYSIEQPKSQSEVMSEIDPREYKFMKAMRSNNLVFIDSDDEEDPIKQIKSAPTTIKTDMIAVPNKIEISSAVPPLYNMEGLFTLESNNYWKERICDSLFIIEEKYLKRDCNDNF